MKTSMKLMVMTLVVAMLLSMSAFAASVEYEALVPTLNEAGTDYSVVVNYSATGYAAGDQVTMLVLKDSAEITWEDEAETIPSNVIYIDQQTISNEAAGETALEGSFTFTIAKTAVDGKEVFVKLGATSQTTADQDSYTFTVEGGEDDEEPEVTVTVNPVENAFGVTGLKIAKITDIPVGKMVTATGADVVYGTYAGATYCYIISAGEISASTVTLVDGEPSEVYVLANADFGVDGVVDIYDATAILNYLGTPSLLDTVTKKFIADVTYDGILDIYDATAVLNVLGGAAPGAAQ